MEERKIDINSIIGFILIFGILVFMLYQNQPSPEELEAQKAEQEQVETPKENLPKAVDQAEPVLPDPRDSTATAQYKNRLGAFAHTAAVDGVTTLENELLYLEIANKGGQIVTAKMKNFVAYDSVPIYLVKDGNAAFGIDFMTSDNRVLNTGQLYFEPELTNEGQGKVLSMKAKVAPDRYLEFRYGLKPDDYLVDFTVRSRGLEGTIDGSRPIHIDWKLRGIRHSKSIIYENRYTELTYNHEDGNISYLSAGGEDQENEKDVKWLSCRQHFFSVYLGANDPFASAELSSVDLVEEESETAGFTKDFGARIPLALEGGELSKNMFWYYGPTDAKVLAKYGDLDLDDAIPYGWGIFGWINRYVFTPFFSFLSGFLPAGISIIIMTILVRLAMSPVTYKSYLSEF